MTEDLDVVRKRLRLYLRDLGAVAERPDLLDPDPFSDLDLGRSFFMLGNGLTPQDVNYMWARLLLRRKMPVYERFALNDLGHIAFAEHPKYRSFLFVRSPLVLLYGGPYDFQYKNEKGTFSNETWFMEFWDLRQAQGDPIWVYLDAGRYQTIESMVARTAQQVVRLKPGARTNGAGKVTPSVYASKKGQA